MAVRREVVSLSQLLQRRSMGAGSNDRGQPLSGSARPATPLVARASAGAVISGRNQAVTRPPPLRSLVPKPPVQRVRSGYDAQSHSQQDSSYQSQSAQSVYSLSQDEDSYMSLSQPQYSQSQPQYSQSQPQYSQSQPPLSQPQPYFTPSQEEPRGPHARCATPTVQQSKYFQILRESGKTPRKHAEQGESQDDTVEKLLNPIKKGIDDINSALERQQDDHRRYRNDSTEMKKRVEGLTSAVDKLWKQHRESENGQAEARARETTKVASALDDVQRSLQKMHDRMVSFTDFAVRFAEQERTTNRAVLAAMAGVYDINGSSPQLRTRKNGKRKAASSPAVAQAQRKRSRYRPVVASSAQDSIVSSPACSDVIWVDTDSDQGDDTSYPCGADDIGLRLALKKLRDAHTRHHRR